MSAVAENQVLLKESFVEVTYRPEDKIIVAKWKGYLTVDQVRKGSVIIFNQISALQLTKHLSDHSELKILGKELQQYLVNEWFLHAEQLGLRKLAVKLAEDVFAQATVNKVNTQQQYGALTITTFGSCKTAINWLNDKN